jgi:hypothetical protein
MNEEKYFSYFKRKRLNIPETHYFQRYQKMSFTESHIITNNNLFSLERTTKVKSCTYEMFSFRKLVSI